MNPFGKPANVDGNDLVVAWVWTMVSVAIGAAIILVAREDVALALAVAAVFGATLLIAFAFVLPRWMNSDSDIAASNTAAASPAEDSEANTAAESETEGFVSYEVRVRDVRVGDFIVGNRGGDSMVLDPATVSPVRGRSTIETEHGFLQVATDDLLTVKRRNELSGTTND